MKNPRGKGPKNPKKREEVMRYFLIIFLLGVAFGLNGFLPTTPYEPGDTTYRPDPRFDNVAQPPPVTVSSTDPRSIQDEPSNLRPGFGEAGIGRGDLGTPGGEAVSNDAFEDGV